VPTATVDTVSDGRAGAHRKVDEDGEEERKRDECIEGMGKCKGKKGKEKEKEIEGEASAVGVEVIKGEGKGREGQVQGSAHQFGNCHRHAVSASGERH